MLHRVVADAVPGTSDCVAPEALLVAAGDQSTNSPAENVSSGGISA